MSDPAAVIAWQNQMHALLEDGEVPATPVAPPPPSVGVDLRSKDRFYEPTPSGLQYGLGGCYLGSEERPDGTVVFNVVDKYHGRPVWHALTEDEIDWGAYSGLVNVAVVRSTLTVLGTDLARRKGRRTGNHSAAIARLEGALR